MTKSILVGAVAAFGHAIVSLAALSIAVNAGMARFDHGGPPSVVEQVASVIHAVASFPLVFLTPGGLPVAAQWLIFVANSLIWGMVAAAVAAPRFRASLPPSPPSQKSSSLA